MDIQLWNHGFWVLRYNSSSSESRFDICFRKNFEVGGFKRDKELRFSDIVNRGFNQ